MSTELFLSTEDIKKAVLRKLRRKFGKKHVKGVKAQHLQFELGDGQLRVLIERPPVELPQ